MAFEVDEPTLRAIFEEELRPFVFDGIDPYPPGERPVFVQLGGQLAAGKSTALRSLMAQYQGRLAILSPDDYRRFHPQIDQIRHDHPHRMVEFTNQAMYAWSNMVREHAHEHGYGLLTEGTFRSPEYLIQYAQEAARPVPGRHEGAFNKVVAIATPAPRSSLDMVTRYTEKPPGQGRWADIDGHDATFEQLPHSMEALEASAHIDEVMVVDRANTVHYGNSRGPDGRWLQTPQAGQVLRQARLEGRTPFETEEAQEWMDSYWEAGQALIGRGELTEHTAPTMLALHTQADQVAAVAYKGDVDRLEQHERWQKVQKVVFMAGKRGVDNTALPPSPEKFFATSASGRQSYMEVMRSAISGRQIPQEALEAVRRARQGMASPTVSGPGTNTSEPGPGHRGPGRESGLER